MRGRRAFFPEDMPGGLAINTTIFLESDASDFALIQDVEPRMRLTTPKGEVTFVEKRLYLGENTVFLFETQEHQLVRCERNTQFVNGDGQKRDPFGMGWHLLDVESSPVYQLVLTPTPLYLLTNYHTIHGILLR